MSGFNHGKIPEQSSSGNIACTAKSLRPRLKHDVIDGASLQCLTGLVLVAMEAFRLSDCSKQLWTKMSTGPCVYKAAQEMEWLGRTEVRRYTP